MADLWYPWCCCDEGPGGTANCFACGDCYSVPSGGSGGPLQWLVHVPTSVAGLCLGAPCTPAGGDHYLDYVSGCTWISPTFSLCGVSGCFAWILSIGNYPACDPNPVNADQIRLQLANICSGVELARWQNACDAVIGWPADPRCDPPVNLTCDGTMTLVAAGNIGLCFFPSQPNLDVEPVYT